MNVIKEIANNIGVNYESNKSTADLIDFLVDNDMNFERASGYWKNQSQTIFNEMNSLKSFQKFSIKTH